MSGKRLCLNCGGDIPMERQSGAKYYNDSCKARYHEKKLMKELFSGEIQKTNPAPQGKKEAVKNMLTGPEGVAERKVHPQLSAPLAQSAATHPEVKNNAENAVQSVQYAKSEQKKEVFQEPALIPLIIKVETEKYKLVKEKLNVVYKEHDRVKGMIKSCDEQIEKIKRNKDFSFLPLGTTAAAGILAYNNADKKILPTAGGAIAGWAAGKLIDTLFFEKDRKKEAEQAIIKIRNKKTEWQKYLEDIMEAKNKGDEFINKIPRYETKTEMRPSPFLKLKSLQPVSESDKQKLLPGILEGLKQKAELAENNNAPEINATINNTDVLTAETANKEKYPEIETNDRIMSSKAFREMTYPALIFQNRWNHLLGEPSTTFHLVVHGKPGEGKSTFCIQFALYLAKHHGNTIYISGEEGFSKTLQQKVNMTNAEHPRLFFTDFKSYDEIKANMQNNFHFIFVDSLDTLRIDSQKLKELKALHPCSALITISQSTKDGKMRGSQEIIHDADIAVCVHNGIGMTTKNRFKEKGRNLGCFLMWENQLAK